MKMAKVKTIIDESTMFSVVTPSVAKLTEALKSAESWTSKVESMLVGDYLVSCLNICSYLCHRLGKLMFLPVFICALTLLVGWQ